MEVLSKGAYLKKKKKGERYRIGQRKKLSKDAALSNPTESSGA